MFLAWKILDRTFSQMEGRKPANIVIGRQGFESRTYLIDFGLSKSYLDPQTGRHLPAEKKRGSPGTLRFMSMFTHKGHQVSRRDDLQSLAYTLVFLAKGKLPWQEEKREVTPPNHTGGKRKRDHHDRVFRAKKDCLPAKLCSGLPPAFRELVAYSRDLGFDHAPDYARLQSLFRSFLEREGVLRPGAPISFAFDWCAPRQDHGNQSAGSHSRHCRHR